MLSSPLSLLENALPLLFFRRATGAVDDGPCRVRAGLRRRLDEAAAMGGRPPNRRRWQPAAGSSRRRGQVRLRRTLALNGIVFCPIFCRGTIGQLRQK